MIGFLLAPLAACMIFWLISSFLMAFVVDVGEMGILNGILFLLPFAYGSALLLGVPAHLALRRGGMTSLRHYVLSGIAIGLAPGMVLATVAPITVAVSAWIPGFVLGAFAGTLFWVIALAPGRISVGG